MNDLYLEQPAPACTSPAAVGHHQSESRRFAGEQQHILGETIAHLALDDDDTMTREVTEKPGENNTAPIIPAYCNFQVARKMHVENLEHQPLPDSIMDKAFRRLQAQGAANPELALDIMPAATGEKIFSFLIACLFDCLFI